MSQIEAGGVVGLNIQTSSVVILTEPQWKPSTESQAIARCHRMGQARTVHVHRLLAENSVDERMLEILRGKAALFDEYVRRRGAGFHDSQVAEYLRYLGGETGRRTLVLLTQRPEPLRQEDRQLAWATSFTSQDSNRVRS